MGGHEITCYMLHACGGFSHGKSTWWYLNNVEKYPQKDIENDYFWPGKNWKNPGISFTLPCGNYILIIVHVTVKHGHRVHNVPTKIHIDYGLMKKKK